jgi:hypothetical protein
MKATKRCLPYLLGVCSISFVFAPAKGQDDRIVPELRANRVNGSSPVIDGDLDDPAWNMADLDYATRFTQREPDEGEAATESTRVAVVYDETAIYFAFWCYDSEPEKVARQLVRRDRSSEADYVRVNLDPYHDHQTGYCFWVNAANVQQDARLFNENWMEYAWDGVWSSAVKMQPWGWSAELRIPYHCIRFARDGERTWGVDFARGINRKTEDVRWAFTPASEGGFVSNFGHLIGLAGIEPASHLELLPYAVSGLEAEPAHRGNPDGRDWNRNLGFDLKYGLATNLTLDATVNPDFGQVELDQPVLNLSAYETWYEERRPFFMEGMELFNTEFQLFYSRRIGRLPSGDAVEDPLYYTRYPKSTTILGATKLTGKLASGTEMALLSAVTEEEKARYAVETADGDTVFDEGVVEPGAAYTVLRIKQDLLTESNVGGMLTLAAQDREHPATTGGIDWRLKTNSGYWTFLGQSVFSRVDNRHSGFGADITFERSAGEHVRGSVGMNWMDRYLQLNRLGYLWRNDFREGWGWLQYRTTDDWWIFRNTWNNVNVYGAWNSDGANISRGWNYNNQIQFVNNWYGWMGFAMDFPKYDDRETRGHGLWEMPDSWYTWVSFDTDERKKWSFEFDYYYGESRTSPWWAGEVGVRYRPVSNMEFWVHGEYTHDFDQLMWVENPDEETTIFADKDQNIFELEASASVVFRPNLSLQLSTQGLLTGLDYRDYRPYLGGGRYGPLQVGYDHDYNYSALNSTLLLRWEYRPGSTLYLVWTRAREEVDEAVNDLNLSRDFERFYSGGGENVFLVKVSYWMNM